eukprot:4587826-Pyramimonas_sp.AAC.1
MTDFKRSRAAAETFQAHLLDWGVELILMKTATPLEVLGYTKLVAKVAEEHGGARTDRPTPAVHRTRRVS